MSDQSNEAPSPEPAPSYHDTLLAVLDMMSRGPVAVAIDARGPDVLVPDHVRGPYLVLVLAYNHLLQRPIRDLRVDAEGFSGVLSFSGEPHPVEVPWSRVWRANSHSRSVLWGERVPAVIAGAESPGVLTEDDPEQELVEVEIVDEDPDEPTPPRARHLRLVD